MKVLLPLFKISFFIPLFGNGKARFQPVFIDDISIAVNKIIIESIMGKHTFELVGPEIFTYKEFYDYLAVCLGCKRVLIPIPLWLAKIGISILEKTPISPINNEQLKLFERDNVSSNRHKKFSDLSIEPQDISEKIKKIIEKNS
jgi:NADH dehydrogenase